MEYKIIQKNVKENTFYIKLKILGFIWIYLKEPRYFGNHTIYYNVSFNSIQEAKEYITKYESGFFDDKYKNKSKVVEYYKTEK